MNNNVIIVMNSFPELSETFIRDHISCALNVSKNVFVGAKIVKSNRQALKGYEKMISRTKVYEISDYYKFNISRAIVSLLNPINILHLLNLNFNKREYKKKILNLRFKKFLQNNQIKNIHFHFGDVAKEFLKVIGPIENVKIHVTFHGYDIRNLSREPDFYKPIINYVDTPIAISTWNKNALKKAGFHESKIKRINNPIDDEFFSRTEQIMDQNLVRILAVGRLEKVKAFDNLLKSFSLLIKRFEETHLQFNLTIVGDGSEKANLLSIISKLEVRESVNLVGAKNRIDIKKNYNNSDFLVISSAQEALPTVMLEAMSMSLPIVATPVGSIPFELSDENILCRSTEPVDIMEGIEQMIKLKKLWSSIGASNREFVTNNYGKNVLKIKLANIY